MTPTPYVRPNLLATSRGDLPWRDVLAAWAGRPDDTSDEPARAVARTARLARTAPDRVAEVGLAVAAGRTARAVAGWEPGLVRLALLGFEPDRWRTKFAALAEGAGSEPDLVDLSRRAGELIGE